MKFANIDGKSQEAQPGLRGECRLCRRAVTAKCGRYRIWHWAHLAIGACDSWAEGETEWHRSWKNEFPNDWQEKIHTSPSGEIHIADVKTESGMVLEFQHSNLSANERRSREAFYRKMVWIVDGRRRLRDKAQFFDALGRAIVVGKLQIRLVQWHEGALLRDWGASQIPVYFDFGDRAADEAPTLWRLNPVGQSGRAYVSPVPKAVFLRAQLVRDHLQDRRVGGRRCI